MSTWWLLLVITLTRREKNVHSLLRFPRTTLLQRASKNNELLNLFLLERPSVLIKNHSLSKLQSTETFLTLFETDRRLAS